MSQPNIVWISLESVRYDHTSMSTYDRDTTPFLRELATKADSTSFSRCFCPATWTVPATASMLTGTYLSTHGLGGIKSKLDGSLDTVPTLLSECGYDTGICTQSPIITQSRNLDRDFDRSATINKTELIRERRFGTVLEYLRNYREHTTGFPLGGTNFNTSVFANEVAKDFLSEMGSNEPFFLYLHYGDSHHPFTPPLTYLDSFTENIAMDPQEALECSIWMRENINQIMADGCDLSTEQWEAILAMYDATLLYTDDKLRELLQYIRGLDLGDVIYVITADHGELFGEHGLLGHHMVVDDALSHVPLVVDGLDDIQVPDDGLVQQIDVMETLLDIAGAETEQFQGIDVRSEERDFVITERSRENFSAYAHQILEHNRSFDLSRFPPSFLSALRTGEFKYLSSDQSEGLFKLPNEEIDVQATYPETTRELRATFTRWKNSIDTDHGSRETLTLSSTQKEQLEDLGYL